MTSVVLASFIASACRTIAILFCAFLLGLIFVFGERIRKDVNLSEREVRIRHARLLIRLGEAGFILMTLITMVEFRDRGFTWRIAASPPLAIIFAFGLYSLDREIHRPHVISERGVDRTPPDKTKF